MKLDFKNFHKIECDDNCTVLQHPNGHEIKIAHKGLKPEHQKELDSLPMKMAKGGKITYQQFMDQHGSKASKPSQPSGGTNSIVPEAAYTPPKEAKNAFTEPDNQGTQPYEDVVIKALHRETPPLGPLGSEKPHYPPCINPSCKSFGRSHPNCRCYGGNPQGKPKGEMPGMFAEGGEVESYCSKDNPHQEGCEYFKAGGMALGEEQMPEAPVEQPTAPVEPPPTEVAQSPIAQPQVNPNPEVAPVAPMQQKSPVQEAQDHGAQVAQHLMGEDAAVKSDINAGHITPLTYKDLFEKKDTLGKIGTLFGMLVSGAGAGLSHQPNALMQMMDQTIQNDLKSQETSATNKQNILKINQANLANQAGIKLTEQQAKQLALANSYMNANRMALDSLVQANSKLPEGSPQRQQGDQILALLSQHVDQKNATIASQAGMAAALAKAASFGQGGGQNTQMMKSGLLGPEFKNMGEDIEQKTIPGIPGQAQRPIAEHDRQQVKDMNVLSDKAKDLIDFAQKHVGTLRPSEKATAKQKAEELINFYNSSLGGTLGEGRLDWLQKQIKTNPTGIVPYIMGNQATLKEILKSNDHRKGILLQSYGFQNQGGQAPQEQLKIVDGIKYRRGPGGEAIRVK